MVEHDADHWRELGIRLRRQGNLAESEEALRRALEREPLQAETWFNLGAVLVGRGEALQGIEAYRKALDLKPDYAEAWSNLGGALGASGDRAGEIEAYRRALDSNPRLAPVWSNLGSALLDAGDIEAALSACRRAVELAPEFAAAWSNLGNTLHEHGEHADAVRACERALQLAPDLAEAWSNLGCALLEQGAIERSLAAHRRALELQPRDARMYYNLGIAQERCLEYEAATDSYRRASAIDPAFVPGRLKLANILLIRGQLAEGWKEYEWRWRDPAAGVKRYDFTPWDGNCHPGLRLLLWGEQGLGDRIIYASMIGDFVGAGVQVTLETEPRLVTLMQRSFPEVRVVPKEPQPALDPADFDCQSPLGSLGRWLRKSFDAFPRRRAFLEADAGRVRRFTERLRRSPRESVVGVSWRSANKEIGGYKSTALADWAPILKSPGIRFVDLQYGDTVEARLDLRQRFGLEITHFDDVDLFNDLEAVAALCGACDLVITVSNVTAHIAGALGRPVWLLVPRWRGVLWYWFAGRSDSPWYPPMRIFQQTEPGEWRPLFNNVSRELARLDDGP